jgi:uncharacterized protein
VSSIKEQLETLVALQKAELEIGRIEQELAGMEDRMASLNSEVTACEASVAESQTELDTLRKQYRSDENEVKGIDSQIIKSEEKLRAVKTNKEYQSMLKEIDELKNKSSAIEDLMLEHLDRIEMAESAINVRKQDLASVQAEVAVKQEEVRRSGAMQRQTLQRLQEERTGIWETIAPKLQVLYTKVKKQGQGIAVAAIVDAVCQVCRMNIPPQHYNELLRMDMMRMCPNCQRIIYPKMLLEED